MFVKVLNEMSARNQPDVEQVDTPADYASLWTELIDRGGLYHNNVKVFYLFKEIEIVVRSFLNESNINSHILKATVGNRCWSYVGKDANNHPGEMTMFLDLFNLHQPDQQSLVIHEFGHALGMEHEHQRSDFWKVLDGLLKDKHNLPGACAEHRVSNTTCGNYDYDPMSIMHCWFDKTWLKDEYQVDDLSKVKDIPGLLPKQEEVIRGVHIRDHRNGRLTKEPSEGDFKALDAEYKLAAKQK